MQWRVSRRQLCRVDAPERARPAMGAEVHVTVRVQDACAAAALDWVVFQGHQPGQRPQRSGDHRQRHDLRCITDLSEAAARRDNEVKPNCCV